MANKLTDKITQMYDSTRNKINDIKNDLKFRFDWAKEFAPDYVPQLATVNSHGDKTINWKSIGTTAASIGLPVAFSYAGNGNVENDMQKIANDMNKPAVETSAAKPLDNKTYHLNNNDLKNIVQNPDSTVCADPAIFPGKFKHAEDYNYCIGDEIGTLDEMFKERAGYTGDFKFYTKGNSIEIKNGKIVPVREGTTTIYEKAINPSGRVAEQSYAIFVVDDCSSENHKPDNYKTDTNDGSTTVVVKCSDCDNDDIGGILQKKAEWEAAKAKGKAKIGEYESKIDMIEGAIDDDCDKKPAQSSKSENAFQLNDATVGPYISKTDDFLGKSHLEVGARWQPTGLSHSGPVLNIGFIAPLAEGQYHSLDENIDRSIGADAHFYNVKGDMNLVGVNASLGASLEIGPFNMNLEGYAKVWKPTGVVQIDNLTAQNGYLNREEGLPFELNKLLLEYGANVELNLPLAKGLITPFASVGYAANDIFETPMKFDKIAGNSKVQYGQSGINMNEFNNYNPWTAKAGVVIGFNAFKQNNTKNK